MRIERDVCGSVRMDLSARIDGESAFLDDSAIEAHLASCGACRSFEGSLHKLRRAMRIREADVVPDLTDRILAALPPGGERPIPLGTHFRTAGLAAAASFILLWGATWIGGQRPADSASAAAIVGQVRGAARSVSSYTATFEIVERNWSAALPMRRFVASVALSAPENFHLRVEDVSPSVAGYIRQEYDLRAGPRRWRARLPAICAPAAPPRCRPSSPSSLSRNGRQPFDGTAFVPTDVVLPLETLSSTSDLRLLGTRTIGGREAVGVRVSLGTATPLLHSLDPFGIWRPFHPQDEVDLWLDPESWFPLRFEVRAARGPERELWAARAGVVDRPGEMILKAAVVGGIGEGVPGQQPPRRADASTSGGFREEGFDSLEQGPAYVARLEPYRAGSTSTGDRVVTYSSGLAWLKVTRSRLQPMGVDDFLQSEELRVGSRFLYYRPATVDRPRQVDVYGDRSQLRFESNLPREQLVRIALSSPVHGTRARPARGGAVRRTTLNRLQEQGIVKIPGWMPDGYGSSGAFIVDGPGPRASVVLRYRRAEFDSSTAGIVITQSFQDVLPPTSEEPVVVPVGEVLARWSLERGELAFVDDGIYVSIMVPSFDLAAATAIARGLL